MYLSLPAALLSLVFLRLTSAGQHPLEIRLDQDVCTVPEKDNLLALSQHLKEQQCGFETCGQWEYGNKTVQSASAPTPTPTPSPAPASTSPWTHKRKCMWKGQAPESYCVYTNNSFANGRGISFFTTPTIAKRVLALPAFTQPDIHDNAKILDNPPWEVKSIPGRGNGLFATRTLDRGDLVLTDTPLGVYNSDAFPSDHGLGYEYLHKTFDQLSEPSQKLFLETAMHYEGDAIMERINTNAFHGEFEGAPHFLLYPYTAVGNSVLSLQSELTSISV